MPTDPRAGIKPAPMEAHGSYNRSSQVQSSGLSPAIPWLREAAATVTLPDGDTPIVVADYGASEGHNSIAPMAAAIEELRRRVGASRPISVIHTDLPTNDFGTLFTTLADEPTSYLRTDPNTYAAAVGRSFYRQILPPASVTLGWSSWAVQWLSRTPGSIPDQVQVAYSEDAESRQLFASQAAADWADFLRFRSAELRPGGALVVLTMAMTDDGDFGYGPSLEGLYDTLLESVTVGLVRPDEAGRMAIPTVGRRRADLLAPFDAAGTFAGLRVARADVFMAPDSIWADFQRDGDAARFGARWAAFSRASVLPTLARSLEPSDEARTAAFIDFMEQGLARRLSAHPSQTTLPLARFLAVKSAG